MRRTLWLLFVMTGAITGLILFIALLAAPTALAHASVLPEVGGKQAAAVNEDGSPNFDSKNDFNSAGSRVNYRDDWIGADYPAGHTFWITVTDGTGAVKATAQAMSVPGGGWGVDGFETVWEQWVPQPPDIVPGDEVYLASDDGYTNVIEVGEITGTVDVAADSVSGRIYAPFAQPLTVECHPWGAPAGTPGKDDVAPPDGSAPYLCDWSTGEWDVLPGQDIGVMYVEPDGDRVIAAYHAPAPYLRLEMWVEGSGITHQDGNMLFHIRYRNEGDAPAENVEIEQVFEGMRYWSDTSPFAVMTGTETATYFVGTVLPGTEGSFQVFAEVTEAVSNTVSSNATIFTSNPYDQGEPWDKTGSWSGHVAANDTYLNVGKWAWTGDPTPDTDVVFSVNVCNQGSTASSMVVLTDTLHPAFTFLNWWAEQPGWFELAAGSEVVLAVPTVPGQSCRQAQIRAHLNAALQPGDLISNTAVIAAADDLSGEDNLGEWYGQINEPHTNLTLGAQWGHGILVPGGTLNYNVHLENNGNTPVAGPIYVTDTLPPGTSFVRSWQYGNFTDLPYPPAQVTADSVVWDIGSLPNGVSVDFNVQLAVDAGLDPGDRLTNTFSATLVRDEDSYADNRAVVVEELYGHGPNLRAYKEGGWHGEGMDTRRAWYNLRVENVGDVSVARPTLTDTLPAGMELDGPINGHFWLWWTWAVQPAANTFTATLERLDPGTATWLWFETTVRGVEPVPQGMIFTNTVDVTVPAADANPGDNHYEQVLTTGPDLFVEKELVAGELRPDELITFSIRFGNDRPGHEWWWNTAGEVWLEDVLPPGLEYVSATLRDCGGVAEAWCPLSPADPQDSMTAWNMGQLWTGYENEIWLTVRIRDTVRWGAVLENVVEIGSTMPASDTEPFYDNNSAALTLVLEGVQLGLPVIVKH